jgi:hypothetical protein
MNDDASVTDPSQARTSERWARFRFGVVGRLLAAPPSPGELPAQLRLLVNLGNDLLQAALRQERETLDEKLYFEVFASEPKPRTKRP